MPDLPTGTVTFLLTDIEAAGDYAGARTYHLQSLAIRREIGTRRGVVEALERLAKDVGAKARERGTEGIPSLVRAARLFGAAAAAREGIGLPRAPIERTAYEAAVAALHAALEDEACAAAWAEGEAMSLEKAATYALEENAHG
jgi:hypothetical protein